MYSTNTARCMKKLFILLGIIFFLSSSRISFAQAMQNTDMSDIVSSASATAVEQGEEEQYILPYPGLLPDNPLYGIKTTRDRLVGFLITNSAKKAAFNLLQADKRLQAGTLLVEKDPKKFVLAQATISKGENYFEEAILKTKEAEKQGLETGELKAKLPKALRKHISVITDLQKKAPKDQKSSWGQLLKRLITFEKQVKVFDANTNR
jgi:hypothetical protein